MVVEVLARQAKAQVDWTDQPFGEALVGVLKTQAGRQLTELADGPHRHERAADWQGALPWQRAEERHYSWLESYIGWLEGREARSEYHALLEEEFASLGG
jgi:hypothetical protein